MKTSSKVVLVHPIDYGRSGFFIVGPCLKVGTVYCVERVVPRQPHWRTDGLVLVGHTTFCAGSGCELGYDIRCFRLLEDLQLAAQIRKAHSQDVVDKFHTNEPEDWQRGD